MISASGDIGAHEATAQESALRRILRDHDIEPPDGGRPLTARLEAEIREAHAQAHAAGTEHPEVEIRELWTNVLGLPQSPELEMIAVAYECATNPVWPMAGALALLKSLRRRGLILGIVSNAQFYTPYLFDAFFEQPLETLGFEPELCFFSYEHRQAKPGLWLYEELRKALSKRGIEPAEVLYVGNDALKDVHPAAELGFRTALFAGDRRSLRLREDQTGLHPPDAVVTDLSQIEELLERPE